MRIGSNGKDRQIFYQILQKLHYDILIFAGDRDALVSVLIEVSDNQTCFISVDYPDECRIYEI